jgi:hypothetical protein
LLLLVKMVMMMIIMIWGMRSYHRSASIFVSVEAKEPQECTSTCPLLGR